MIITVYSCMDNFSTIWLCNSLINYCLLLKITIFLIPGVPNSRGRVLRNASGNDVLLEEGLYVCGWLKRGPTGIIATNLYCAEETVSVIMLVFKLAMLSNSLSTCAVWKKLSHVSIPHD